MGQQFVADEIPSVRASSCGGERNVGEGEREFSFGAGLVLAGYGLGRGGWSGLLATGLGAGLLSRAITGHCGVYQMLGLSTCGQAIGERPRQMRAAVAASQPNSVDEAGKESFPASDPPAWCGGADQ